MLFACGVDSGRALSEIVDIVALPGLISFERGEAIVSIILAFLSAIELKLT